MRIGLHINNFTWPGSPQALRERLAEVVRTADDAGFSFITVMDHFFQIGPQGPAEMEMLEGYSALSYLAGATKRVRLGTMVTGVTYRYPGVLIKMVTTLDVLSGGRAFLGLGAAWFEREHVGLGIPYPPLKERFERLEETLPIAQHMFAGKRDPYEWSFYQLAEPLLSPAQSRSRASLYSWAAAANKKRCCWSPNTPTRAISLVIWKSRSRNWLSSTSIAMKLDVPTKRFCGQPTIVSLSLQDTSP